MLIDCIEKLIRGENKFINNKPVVNMNEKQAKVNLNKTKSCVQFQFMLLNFKAIELFDKFMYLLEQTILYLLTDYLTRLFLKLFNSFQNYYYNFFYAWQGSKIKISQNFQNETIKIFYKINREL